MFNGRQLNLKFIFSIIICNKCVESVLLYPQFTVFQLVGSISVPIVDLLPDRKLFFDWGFQMNYDMPFNISSFYMIPIWATNGTSRMSNLYLLKKTVHQHDFTAKELYEGFENILERYGYDRSCLKRSICELSQHPFDEVYKNIVTDAIEFFLTPSLHQGFSSKEKYAESLYRSAEDQGFLGKNCQKLYPQCFESQFSILTIIDFMRF